jgi:hypothetical protein
MRAAYNFHILCLEARIYDLGGEGAHSTGGLWQYPFITTDETGPRCSGEDSADNTYLESVIAEIDK